MMAQRTPPRGGTPGTPGSSKTGSYDPFENVIWTECMARPVATKGADSILKRMKWLSKSPLRHDAERSGAAAAAAEEAGHRLRLAAITGDVAGIGAALEAGADVDDVDELEGNTALFVAAKQGHSEAVDALAEAGADVLKPNGSGQLPLQESVRAGHAAVVRVLMTHGAMPEDDGTPGTHALLEAAHWGHCGTVKALLEDPFQNPDVENGLGETPVIAAAREGHAEVVAVLAARGANVNHRAANGSTALMLAAEDNRVKVRSLPSPLPSKRFPG